MSATGKTLSDYLEALPDGSVRWQVAFLALAAPGHEPATFRTVDEALAWLNDRVAGWWPVVDAMHQLEAQP